MRLTTQVQGRRACTGTRRCHDAAARRPLQAIVRLWAAARHRRAVRAIGTPALPNQRCQDSFRARTQPDPVAEPAAYDEPSRTTDHRRYDPGADPIVAAGSGILRDQVAYAHPGNDPY